MMKDIHSGKMTVGSDEFDIFDSKTFGYRMVAIITGKDEFIFRTIDEGFISADNEEEAIKKLVETGDATGRKSPFYIRVYSPLPLKKVK